LDLLAAVALLVWGTHLVCTGMLRVFGRNLRRIRAASTGNRFTAVRSGLGGTKVVQSNIAAALNHQLLRRTRADPAARSAGRDAGRRRDGSGSRRCAFLSASCCS